ncbi:sigma-70 family RNA polymerase sigma factor [Arthrobacter pigmenti]
METNRQELAALLAATARADRRAFTDFYDRTSRRVYGLICDMTAGTDHRNDVMQHVYVLAWQHAGRYDPATEDPMVWILTLARRHAVDYARPEPAVTPTGSVDMLGPDERESITMAYGAGMTYQKVAETLGVAEGTIRGRIRDGMRTLNHNHAGPHNEH